MPLLTKLACNVAWKQCADRGITVCRKYGWTYIQYWQKLQHKTNIPSPAAIAAKSWVKNVKGEQSEEKGGNIAIFRQTDNRQISDDGDMSALNFNSPYNFFQNNGGTSSPKFGIFGKRCPTKKIFSDSLKFWGPATMPLIAGVYKI